MLSQLPFIVAEYVGSFVRAGPSLQKDIPSCSPFTTICENCFLWTVCACGNIHYTCQIFIRKEIHSRRRGTFWVYLYLCELPKAHEIPVFTWNLSAYNIYCGRFKADLHCTWLCRIWEAHDCRLGPKSCRRPVVNLLCETKLHRVNQPLERLANVTLVINRLYVACMYVFSFSLWRLS